MSVLRFLRVRVARLLIRLARRLDSAGLPLPPFEQFDALRRRYPGAPDHWLQLVAKRTPIAFAPPSPAPEIASEREARQINPDPPREEWAEPSDLDFSTSRSGARVFFPDSEQQSRARPAVGFSAPTHRRPPMPVMSVGHPPHRTRNVDRSPNFVRGLQRIGVRLVSRAPSASKQRARRNSLKFSPAARVRQPAAAEYQPPPAVTHDRPDPSSFGETCESQPRRLDWEPKFKTQALEARQPADPQFASPAPKRLNEPSWIAGNPAQMFHPAEFQPSKNEWPKLPSVNDDDRATPDGTSEQAALVVEQMGGRWSA
jgi:hypothetical protein